MQNSENIQAFDTQRSEFSPYGLSCVWWKPTLMNRPDRHNEIEINYFFEGSITYLFQGKKITIPKKCLAVFWGLMPHQIVNYTGTSPYFVSTIPMTQFLEWKLPTAFADRVLNGEILMENCEPSANHEEYMLNQWVNDAKMHMKATQLEIQARLLRMADRMNTTDAIDRSQLHSSEISQVEQIAIFIAKNYHRSIKAGDIGNAVELHPDYANNIFKKTFGNTINEYLIQERISHAKRKLISTDKSISDISYECGFNSMSSFNAAFRKLSSCTPREFRKEFVSKAT